MLCPVVYTLKSDEYYSKLLTELDKRFAGTTPNPGTYTPTHLHRPRLRKPKPPKNKVRVKPTLFTRKLSEAEHEIAEGRLPQNS